MIYANSFINSTVSLHVEIQARTSLNLRSVSGEHRPTKTSLQTTAQICYHQQALQRYTHVYHKRIEYICTCIVAHCPHAEPLRRINRVN